jgi:tricorn protease
MSPATRAAFAGLALVTLLSAGSRAQGVPPILAEPGISGDGREIAFVSGGDIWSVPATGGDARLLVSHSATESRPLFSPTGRALAFVSTRTGGGDIYVLRFGDATVTRLTFDDGPEVLDGWSRDGRAIYFSSTTRDIAGMNDVFRVSVDGGTPMPVTNERYTNEFFSAASPDGTTLAFSARGIASGQWWRNGHSHIDESEIWTRSIAGAYTRIVDRGAKALWPMWAGDGKSLYFMSDRSGSENIWHAPLQGAAKAVTSFARGRVLWPSITTDGKTIAFEKDFGVWTVDTASGRTTEVKVELRGAAATPAAERQRLTSQFTELAIAPDGKKAGFVVRGEVFASSSRDPGDAERVTTTPAREFGVEWSPDSRKLYYVSERDNVSSLVTYDVAARRETVLTTTPEELGAPVVSPDGKTVAYLYARAELRTLVVDTKQVTTVAKGSFASGFETTRPVVWSPDGKWMAYLARGARGFFNIMVVPSAVTAAPPQPASFLANLNTDSIAWSPDGTFLTFATGQRTEDGQVARVDLVLRTPKFREDRFRSLFEQETPKPAPAPAPITPSNSSPSQPSTSAPQHPNTPAPVFDNIRERLSLIPVGVDVQDQTISPDGKLLLITAVAAGQTNLYTYSIDELSREPAVARQLTSTPGNKGSAQFTADSKEVFYLDAGRPQVITIEDRRARALEITAELDIDFGREKSAVFQQAWRFLNDNFFDDKHNGVNWRGAREAYGMRVEGSRTPDEMRRVTQLMIGELNASHLGFSAPGGQGGGPTTGRLGVRFDAAEYSRSGTLRISEIIPLGPVAVAGGARIGDAITAIDGQSIPVSANLDERLLHTIGKRVVLTVSGDSGAGREVAVRPINLATEKGLLYRAWVEQTRAMVGRLSNGRLGYAHMPDMSAQSLEQLFVDLDAENHAREGVVIDVRNNNGGFVNVYAIDMLARRSYFNMTLRGGSSVPSRSVLGQRALERPTILVTNQHSLSDAEDFTEGYRSLKLGSVVGEPTAGWIIFTWNQAMFDGSVLRLPRMRITAADGSDMEMKPRPVDVPVTRPIGEGALGRDSQIETAVKELLAQVAKLGTP